MAIDLQLEREQAHALIDQLSPAKLGAVRSLLEVMLDDDDEELTDEDRRAIREGLDSREKHGTVSMEEVLSDLGITVAEFETMMQDSEPASASERHG
jgi:hypothetical protein